MLGGEDVSDKMADPLTIKQVHKSVMRLFAPSNTQESGDDMSDVSREMPRYECHKKVWALKIAAIEVHEDKSATIAPSDYGYGVFKTEPGWADRFHGDESDPGVYVVYQDGFKSWSPTTAFESGYTAI